MVNIPDLANKPKALHRGNTASVRNARRRAAERRSWLKAHSSTCTISEAAVALDTTAPVLRKDAKVAGITMLPEDRRVKPNHRHADGLLANEWLKKRW